MGKGSGGLLGGVSQTLFGDGGAGAAQNAAMAQQAESRAMYNDLKGASVGALASLDKDIENQSKNLSRQEQLISQLDPTVIEASQQALRLLRGESSSTLAPVQEQRNQQRQKLLNQLREQLGPGAETSTAGIQALTRFDSETNNLLAGQQQSALANLGNVSSQFSAQRPDMFREIMGLSQLGQGKFGIAQSLANARQGLVQTAGAQFTGDILRGQQNAAFGKALISGAATAAGGAMGGPAGAKAGSELGNSLGPDTSATNSYVSPFGNGNYSMTGR